MASRSAKKSAHLKIEKVKEHEYNARGAPEMEEADDEEAGMHKGGKTKRHRRRHGGHAEGHETKPRADKKKRHHRASGGRTPYTSGHNTSSPSESGKTGRGHESERP